MFDFAARRCCPEGTRYLQPDFYLRPQIITLKEARREGVQLRGRQVLTQRPFTFPSACAPFQALRSLLQSCGVVYELTHLGPHSHALLALRKFLNTTHYLRVNIE